VEAEEKARGTASACEDTDGASSSSSPWLARAPAVLNGSSSGKGREVCF